ncbi:MAG: alpha/beta fold hydrolase, partial [Acidimicrobiia bacterium]
MSSGVLRWVEVSDGPRLATWTWQAGQPTWLLVHGLASNARLWDGMANILSSLGQTVISVDQRGHGLSDRPEGGYDFATISSDLAAVIDNMVDPPVIAVGQSWGANVVLDLAARRPDLVSSVVGIDGGFIELSASFEDWESASATLRPPDLPPITWAAATEQAESFYPGFPPDGVLAQLANLE